MKWTMKNGTAIDIKDMADSHLLYSLRLSMERKSLLSSAVSSAYSMSCILTGEMAMDSIERDITDMERTEFSLERAVSELRKEVDKRGLTPLALRTKLMT